VVQPPRWGVSRAGGAVWGSQIGISWASIELGAGTFNGTDIMYAHGHTTHEDIQGIAGAAATACCCYYIDTDYSRQAAGSRWRAGGRQCAVRHAVSGVTAWRAAWGPLGWNAATWGSEEAGPCGSARPLQRCLLQKQPRRLQYQQMLSICKGGLRRKNTCEKAKKRRPRQGSTTSSKSRRAIRKTKVASEQTQKAHGITALT
jgi:hypothetical protein